MDGAYSIDGTLFVRQLIALQLAYREKLKGKYHSYSKSKLKELKFGNNMERGPRSLGR